MVIAFLMRSPFFKEGRKMGENGNYNGYVAFKESLPLSQQGSYWDGSVHEEYLDDYINIHGGITFDHSSIWEEAAIIPLTEIPEDFRSYRVIGFDCCHWGDTVETCSFEFVKEETFSLKKQIENLIKNNIQK